MAIIADGTTPSQLLAVDSSFKAARASLRPLDQGALGHYRMSAASGALAGAAASAPVFSFRWADATRLAVVTSIIARQVPTTLFTAAQEHGVEFVVARSFSASDTAGTAIVTTGNQGKLRTSHATSLVTDMRISATAAVTAGTRTLDTLSFANSSGWSQDINAAAATQQLVVTPVVCTFQPDAARGEHPLVLAQNEGFIVRETVALGAAGVVKLQVEVQWTEVTAY
jgi:hypothetical protein